MIPHAPQFHLPDEANATTPPEKRGIRRDQVRLLALDSNTGSYEHSYFYHLENYLSPGDLLVLNNSRTIPPVLDATLANGKTIEIRLAKRLSNTMWEVLIPVTIEIDEQLYFREGLVGKVIASKLHSPLKQIEFNRSDIDLYNYFYKYGEPVRYEYIHHPWTLDDYQTAYAIHPGSVEMPSAGRAFSWELLFRLQKKGINIAFLQLHTGLSYLLDDAWDHSPENNEEFYSIPKETVALVKQTQNNYKQVIAVGTTVVRALETMALTAESSGWTNLYIQRDFNRQITNGLITGLHEPKSSHLEMLTSFIDESLLLNAYEQAIKEGYLWHEFGDMNLILPEKHPYSLQAPL
ncbi:S-adenosylmethionine:tRNA ribosyltransferase-isomerase [Oceanobacillus sp. 1P07AA]|uniref:S-adenosylmethionine:tRNA ribosyltransferase-isomerase n=1 Tax=Oceanobacillus sp. 1P07AA TaxID=3132293 RepID=UPI0039A41E4D